MLGVKREPDRGVAVLLAVVERLDNLLKRKGVNKLKWISLSNIIVEHGMMQKCSIPVCDAPASRGMQRRTHAIHLDDDDDDDDDDPEHRLPRQHLCRKCGEMRNHRACIC